MCGYKNIYVCIHISACACILPWQQPCDGFYADSCSTREGSQRLCRVLQHRLEGHCYAIDLLFLGDLVRHGLSRNLILWFQNLLRIPVAGIWVRPFVEANSLRFVETDYLSNVSHVATNSRACNTPPKASSSARFSLARNLCRLSHAHSHEPSMVQSRV